MVDVISLSGASGIGEDIVTLGLGPEVAPPVPPGPGPSEGGSAAAYAEGIWRERWRRIAEERLQERLFKLAQGAVQQSIEIAGQGGIYVPPERRVFLPGDDPNSLELGYVVMPVGEGDVVRAPAAGVIRYRRHGFYGLVGALETTTGLRYLIVELLKATKQSGDYVAAGEPIGLPRPPAMAASARALLAPTGTPPTPTRSAHALIGSWMESSVPTSAHALLPRGEQVGAKRQGPDAALMVAGIAIGAATILAAGPHIDDAEAAPKKKKKKSASAPKKRKAAPKKLLRKPSRKA